MEFEPLGQLARLGGREGLIQSAEGVGVEIVEYQHDDRGVGVAGRQQVANLVGSVDLGAAGGGVHGPPAGLRLGEDEQIRGASPLVLIVDAARPPGHGGEGRAGVFDQLEQQPRNSPTARLEARRVYGLLMVALKNSSAAKTAFVPARAWFL